MSWAGCTLWRGNLAAMLDEPPHEKVESVEVQGSMEHASTFLISAWLGLRLGTTRKLRHSGQSHPGPHDEGREWNSQPEFFRPLTTSRNSPNQR